MTVLCDRQIAALAHKGMITPFSPTKIRHRGGALISCGLGSFGYDIALDRTFKIINPIYAGAIDPKDYDPRAWLELKTEPGSPFAIPPRSFVLATSIETFSMPPDVLGLPLDKSTYTRSGVILGCAPLEPGWEGRYTLQISNTGPLPVLIYPDEGIAQIVFIQGERPTFAYGVEGKYQGDTSITHSKV